LANQIVFGVVAAEPLFDFVAKITGDRDYADCEQIMVCIFSVKHSYNVYIFDIFLLQPQ
jgi:hypothetical protein